MVNGFDSQGNFKASVEYMNQFTENGKPFLLNEAVIPFQSGHGHLRRVVRPSSASQPQQSTNALNVDDYSMSFRPTLADPTLESTIIGEQLPPEDVRLQISRSV